jgi:hypothetical protein
VPTPSPAAVQLARHLRHLRLNHWPDVRVTQATLAVALSTEVGVGAATISSWESASGPKLPPRTRLAAYARFFATPRSLEDEPHLVPLNELTPAEEASRAELERELLTLHEDVRRPYEAEEVAVRRSWQFADSGPLTIICPDVPGEALGAMASPEHPNYIEMLSYADLDALIELFGHIRAENPGMDVSHKLASGVVADDLSGHVVLLGGVAWNDVTKRFLELITRMPIQQIDDPKLKTGDIFLVNEPQGEGRFYPRWARDDETELVEDVGLIARMRNPFNVNRTLTICNGIHSRGVLGAVRCLTDARVRDANENYLASRFPRGADYALLLRVPVIKGQALSPDLHNQGSRLYEWSGRGGAA